jgi:hypothetical protein
VVPDTDLGKRHFLAFLNRDNHIAGAGAVLEKILLHAKEPERDLLLSFCDRAIDAPDQVGLALQVWNRMCARGLLAFEHITTRHPVTNGRFRNFPLSQGFDWRIGSVEGVSISTADRPPHLAVRFDGTQPEESSLLLQYLPVQANKSYRLTFNHQFEGTGLSSGMSWAVTDAQTGASLQSSGAFLTSEEWRENQFSFRTGPGTQLVRLYLKYQRAAPGEVAVKGLFRLREVQVELSREPV